MEVVARSVFGPRTLTTSRWCDHAHRSLLTLRSNWDFGVLFCATINAPLSIDIYQCRATVVTSVVFLRRQNYAK